MKCKLILVMLPLLCLGYATAAQTVSVGTRLGATLTKAAYTGNQEARVNDAITSNTGIQLGFVTNVVVNEVFSVQPELLYGQKGFTLEEEGLTYILRSEYLEVPVLAKLAFGSEHLKGFVTGGPTMGYWTGGEEVIRGEDMEARMSFDFDNKERGYKRFETGASIGVGMAYLTGTGALNLDVRYGFGLSSLFEATRANNTDYKNRAINFSLAYLFNL